MSYRPQYKDYLRQSLDVPSDLPPQPRTPNSKHIPPLPHAKSHTDEPTEHKIFVTPSTSEIPQHGSILKDLKSFNRFNSSRNKSIRSANCTSRERISAHKSERDSRERSNKKDRSWLPEGKSSTHLLDPYKELQTLRKISGQKSHSDLRETLDSKPTPRERRTSRFRPEQSYGDYSMHIPSYKEDEIKKRY